MTTAFCAISGLAGFRNEDKNLCKFFGISFTCTYGWLTASRKKTMASSVSNEIRILRTLLNVRVFRQFNSTNIPMMESKKIVVRLRIASIKWNCWFHPWQINTSRQLRQNLLLKIPGNENWMQLFSFSVKKSCHADEEMMLDYLQKRSQIRNFWRFFCS